mmetsp:Transcript_12514/g.39926  ORF Transcript_12514/g.39926 Transcript_12514/m.39926 type:complete len:273 (-) Transcript_12514:193-1011(-)
MLIFLPVRPGKRKRPDGLCTSFALISPPACSMRRRSSGASGRCTVLVIVMASPLARCSHAGLSPVQAAWSTESSITHTVMVVPEREPGHFCRTLWDHLFSRAMMARERAAGQSCGVLRNSTTTCSLRRVLAKAMQASPPWPSRTATSVRGTARSTLPSGNWLASHTLPTNWLRSLSTHTPSSCRAFDPACRNAPALTGIATPLPPARAASQPPARPAPPPSLHHSSLPRLASCHRWDRRLRVPWDLCAAPPADGRPHGRRRHVPVAGGGGGG